MWKLLSTDYLFINTGKILQKYVLLYEFMQLLYVMQRNVLKCMQLLYVMQRNILTFLKIIELQTCLLRNVRNRWFGFRIATFLRIYLGR